MNVARRGFSNASCTLYLHGAWTNNAKCCNIAIRMITGYFEKIVRIFWDENAPSYDKISIEGKIVEIALLLKNTKAPFRGTLVPYPKEIFISQFARPSFLSGRKLVRNTPAMILTDLHGFMDKTNNATYLNA